MDYYAIYRMVSFPITGLTSQGHNILQRQITRKWCQMNGDLYFIMLLPQFIYARIVYYQRVLITVSIKNDICSM